MAISRRRFIKAGTLTAIAASIAFKPQILAFGQTSQGFPVPLSAQQEPKFMFTKATFDAYVGDVFQAPDALGEMVSLTLLSVKSNKTTVDAQKVTKGRAVQTDSFSLMFKAARRLPEFTSIHRMSHPSLGAFDLFLTPRAKDGDFFYEAVFNHA